MFDMRIPKAASAKKLQEWRARYPARDYPEKVVMNLFYELFAIEGIWPEIERAFSGRRQCPDFDTAYQQMIAMKRNYQSTVLNGQLPRLMSQDVIAADARFSDWCDRQRKAVGGDNEAVVEVEYGYWFYHQYCAATLAWAACGLLGMNKEQAFTEVAGGMCGGMQLNSFRGALQSFQQVLGMVFSGFKDYRGSPIDTGLVMSGRGGKYYPEDFPTLPGLWKARWGLFGKR